MRPDEKVHVALTAKEVHSTLSNSTARDKNTKVIPTVKEKWHVN